MSHFAPDRQEQPEKGTQPKKPFPTIKPKPATDCTCDIDTVCAMHGGPYEPTNPKPATGEHQASILSENAKTVRTLHEWTPELLSRLFDAECSPEEAIRRICSLHKAALSAERKTTEHNAALIVTRLTKQLRTQLEAEKQRNRDEIHKQLATERETRSDDWQDLHDSIMSLIPQEFRQNSAGAASCVKKLVEAYDKAMQVNHEFRHGHRKAK
jgi:flagellar motility protein MotE (MotC chaperone)